MITLRNVRAGYGGREILHGISFDVNDGESLSVIGPNGCGKTTLLRVIAGTLEFTGDILIDGIDIRKIGHKALAKRIAMLPQITQLYFNYTVYDTVMMGRYARQTGGLFGGISEEDRFIVDDALKSVGLSEVKDREAGTLSGGQLQRVFVAKILAQNPDALLLDEPTNHLDLNHQVELVRFLSTWSRSEKKIVIGVMHDINLAALLSDNALLMENGSISAYGKSAEVFSSRALEKAFKMDVASYMLETLRKWERLQNNQRVLP